MARYANLVYTNLFLLFKYFRCEIVYSACGELTYGFALANILRLGRRHLFNVQHHAHHLMFTKGYDRIFFISSVIADHYSGLKNKETLCWGCDEGFAKSSFDTAWDGTYEYYFASIGKCFRDDDILAQASESLGARTLVISDVNSLAKKYRDVTFVAGVRNGENPVGYREVFKYMQKTKFIVIPIIPQPYGFSLGLSGLTSFVDAMAAGKPVLVSDNTNMGVDVENLGLGFVYKAGNMNEMKEKMQRMLEMSDNEYSCMVERVKSYASKHDYANFCKSLTSSIISRAGK